MIFQEVQSTIIAIKTEIFYKMRGKKNKIKEVTRNGNSKKTKKVRENKEKKGSVITILSSEFDLGNKTAVHNN